MSSLAQKFEEESKLDVLNRQTTKPIVLNKVEIVGGDFSEKYYEKLVDPALNEKPVLQLGQLNDVLTGMWEKLLYTGLFNDVSIKLDLDDEKFSTLNKNVSPIPTKAKVSLTQSPQFKYSSYSRSTDFDAAAGFRYLNPNFLKNADSLLVDINVNYDPVNHTLNRKIWDLTYLLPFGNSASGRLIFNPTISSIDAKNWASHDQYSTGGFFGWQNTFIKNGTNIGIFTAGLSATLRSVTDITNNASDIIRTYAGEDVKFGLQSNFKFDSRKFIGKFAYTGSFIDITNELAGHNSIDQYSNDNDLKMEHFNKTLLKLESIKSFFNNNITTSLNLEAGVIKSLDENDGSDKLHISDKFFLGGINSLKGFHLNSVGLKSGNDYVGGSSAFKANFSIFSRLPNTKADSPLRFYNFINCGDVYGFKSLADGIATIKSGDIVTKSAAAAGFGLVYKSNNATLDLSYNVPLTTRTQDEAKPGLSFAVALSFF